MRLLKLTTLREVVNDENFLLNVPRRLTLALETYGSHCRLTMLLLKVTIGRSLGPCRW
jgi:hypothetical protein